MRIKLLSVSNLNFSSISKVNPGAKERLVQITGPNEESINYAKLLIEDTIKRNASPIRETSQEGSCSSLASSDDQPQGIQRTRSGVMLSQQQSVQMSMAGKLQRSSSQHNNMFQTMNSSEVSVEEYKYTVNIGNHCLKITGDSLDLVKVAKLVLDDFFTNEEFLKPADALSMTAEPSMIPAAHQLPTHPSPFTDSGINVDLLAQSASTGGLQARQSSLEPTVVEADEPVVTADEQANAVYDIPFFKSQSVDLTLSGDDNPLTANGLNRSRRSHFSRKDSTPETQTKPAKIESELLIKTCH